MNKWVQQSINLANSQGYLDKLFSIYPIETGELRQISEETKETIKNAFKTMSKSLLVKALLTLPKFPIDDPYISSLRKYPSLLDKNPKTIERIGERLLSIDIKTLLKLVAQPKSPSRQFGNSFKKWLRTIGYPFLSEEKFKQNKDKIAFLEGSDKKLKQFAIRELKIKNLVKGIDFILRIEDRYILGEAKFLTDYGGTQDNQFNSAMKLAKIKKDNVAGIAILDGIVWFESNMYMHRAVKRTKSTAISALLLKKFIRELAVQKHKCGQLK